jgi:predicted alpha/beta hydrolase family esterase
VRVQQRDWDNPVFEEWVAVTEEAMKLAGLDVVLVADSLACLVVALDGQSPLANGSLRRDNGYQ